MKLFVTYKALQFRKANAELFAAGQYVPLQAGDHVVAFGRNLGEQWAVVVAPRWMTSFKGWGDLQLPVPDREWTDVLTGLIPASRRLADVLAEFPVALLTAS
jgi:(1->4)-alpha-D-glucan 1-alpha-D-glucosylmutase